jgi:ubiquinone/menaquinone biosynthesis C-methylase UbiE
VRTIQRYLTRVRDRVLRAAKLRPGECVVDLGAGTGLLALAARSRLQESGYVLALDISFDALAEGRRQAAATPHGAAVGCAVADALRLPLADQSVDVVLMRSVLIYLADKPAGIRELYRVLKPEGRVSIFEPINEVGERARQRAQACGGYDALQPEWGMVQHYYEGHKEQWWGGLVGWDERDVSRWFEDAGFSTVTTSYEFTSEAQTSKPRKADIMAGLLGRPNPHTPSYEEVARTVLGERAEIYLQRFAQFLLNSQGAKSLSASVYLVAKR